MSTDCVISPKWSDLNIVPVVSYRLGGAGFVQGGGEMGLEGVVNLPKRMQV